MREQYDFFEGERGKHAERFSESTNLVRPEPDVAKAFPNSKLVNAALRDLARQRTDTKPED